MLFLDPDGRITVWTASAEASTGIPADEALGRPIGEFCPEIDASRAIKTASRTGFAEFSGRCARRAGKSVPVRVAISPSHDPSGALIGFAAVLTEFNAPGQSGFAFQSAETERLRSFPGGEATPALLTDPADRRIVETSPAASGALSLEQSDLIGRPIDEVLVFSDSDKGEQGERADPAGQPAIVRYAVPGGGERSFEYSILEVLSDGREYLLYVLTDVTRWVEERRDLTRVNLELSHLARHDHLTGLFNKAMFLDTLELANSRLGRSSGNLGVLYIDLDGFKPVNDRFGHDAGDKVLIEIGRRLRASVRASDVIARLGGDEFGAILENLRSSPDARKVAEHLIRRLSEPIVVDDERIAISASIGAVVIDRKASDSAQLLTRADRLMYQSKRRGAGGVVLGGIAKPRRQDDSVR